MEWAKESCDCSLLIICAVMLLSFKNFSLYHYTSIGMMNPSSYVCKKCALQWAIFLPRDVGGLIHVLQPTICFLFFHFHPSHTAQDTIIQGVSKPCAQQSRIRREDFSMASNATIISYTIPQLLTIRRVTSRWNQLSTLETAYDDLAVIPSFIEYLKRNGV